MFIYKHFEHICLYLHFMYVILRNLSFYCMLAHYSSLLCEQRAFIKYVVNKLANSK